MQLRDKVSDSVLKAIQEVVIKSTEQRKDGQQKLAEAEKKKYGNFKPVGRTISEALTGKQKNIDANNNNKIDAQDFKMLKKKKHSEKGESSAHEKGETAAQERMEAVNRDTPGQHMCAVHVKHSKLGEGKTLFTQHATPDAEGNIAWYDVMFEHGIEKKVPVENLEILVQESHGNHKKK